MYVFMYVCMYACMHVCIGKQLQRHRISMCAHAYSPLSVSRTPTPLLWCPTHASSPGTSRSKRLPHHEYMTDSVGSMPEPISVCDVDFRSRSPCPSSTWARGAGSHCSTTGSPLTRMIFARNCATVPSAACAARESTCQLPHGIRGVTERENEYPQSQQESSRRQTSKSRAKRSQSPVCQPHRPDALWSQRVALRGLLPQHLHAALAWRWRRPRDIPQAPVEPTRAAARGAARSAPSHLLSWALIFFSTLRNPPPGLLISSRARACSALSSVSELCSRACSALSSFAVLCSWSFRSHPPLSFLVLSR